RLDGRLRRHLTGAVAAHSIGDDEEAVGCEEAILVVVAHPPDVGLPTRPQGGHLVSSRTVRPIWRRSPRRRGTGPSTFFLFRYVPLVDPRSSTSRSPSRRKTRACSCDT